MRDLDNLPVPDWEPAGTGTWAAGSPALRPLTPRRLEAMLPRRPHTEGTFSEERSRSCVTLKILTSRGCPWACAYCSYPK